MFLFKLHKERCKVDQILINHRENMNWKFVFVQLCVVEDMDLKGL